MNTYKSNFGPEFQADTDVECGIFTSPTRTHPVLSPEPCEIASLVRSVLPEILEAWPISSQDLLRDGEFFAWKVEPVEETWPPLGANMDEPEWDYQSTPEPEVINSERYIPEIEAILKKYYDIEFVENIGYTIPDVHVFCREEAELLGNKVMNWQPVLNPDDLPKTGAEFLLRIDGRHKLAHWHKDLESFQSAGFTLPEYFLTNCEYFLFP